jgi:hypothetical protein
MAAPALSPAGQGRIYFDSTSNKFRISENGGAYTDLIGGTISGSGSANQIPYFTSASALSSSANLTWDTSALVVKNAGNSTTAYQFQTAAGVTVLNVDTTNQRIKVGSTAPDTSALNIGGSVHASGSSGITYILAEGSDTANQAALSAYQNEGGGNTGESVMRTTGSTHAGTTFGVSENYASMWTSYFAGTFAANGKLLFGTLTNNPVIFGSNNAEAMRLHTTTSNVSIGTTSDLGALAVSNGATAESILVLRDNTTTVVEVADGGDTTITEQLGVGVAPTEKLSVKDHSAFTGSAAQLTTGAVQTTDATQTSCKALTLADNTLYWLEADVIGRDTGGTDRAYYKLAGLVYRQGGGATLGTVNVIVEDETNAAWDATLTVSSNDVRVSVTGAAATTINWVCTVRYQAVSGNS